MSRVKQGGNPPRGKARWRTTEIGAGLIEVTISLLITGIGLLSIAQLFGVAATLNIANRNTNFMARAAQESIEVLRAQSFAAVTAGTSTSKYKQLYNVTTKVEEFAGGLKKITVMVEDPTARSGVRRSVFVDYRTDTQGEMGGLYNSLAKAEDCGGEGGGAGHSGSGSGSSSTPTPTPTQTTWK